MAFLSSVAGIPSAYNVGPLTVERPGLPTQNARGGFTPAPSSTFQINPISAVQVQGRDLVQGTDSDRNEGAVEFYVTERVFVADALQVADRITYRGRIYRVTKVEDYALQGGVFCVTGELQETGQP